MKKILGLASVCLLSLGSIATLASCGPSDESTNNTGNSQGGTSNPNSDSPSTPVASQDAGDGVQEIQIQLAEGEFAHMASIINAYNKAARDKGQDELTVKAKLLGISEGDIGNKMNTAADTMPDILHVPGNNANNWADQEKLLAIDLEGEAINGQTVNVLDSALVEKDGATYGGAFTANTFFMYYDKRIFSEEQVESITDMTAALKEYNNANPNEKRNFLIAGDFGNGWQMQSFLFRNRDGGKTLEIQGPEGKDAEPNGFLEEGIKDQIAANFIDLQRILQKSEDLGASINGPIAFKATAADTLSADQTKPNRSAAFISGSWDLPNVVRSIGKENVGCAVLPNFVDTVTSEQTGEIVEIPTPMIQDYKSIVINAARYNSRSEAQQRAITELVKFSLTAESQLIRLEGDMPTPPVVKEEIESEIYENYVCKDAIAGAFVEYSFIQPSTTGWNAWWNSATAIYADFMDPETKANHPFESTESHVSGSNYYDYVAKKVNDIGLAIKSAQGA